MSRIPLPSSTTLRALPSALQWLARKLDVEEPQEEETTTPGDEAEREHEAAELARVLEEKRKEMLTIQHSRVFVPKLPREVILPPPPIFPRVPTKPKSNPKTNPKTKPKTKPKSKERSDDKNKTMNRYPPYPATLTQRTLLRPEQEDENEAPFLTPPSRPSSPLQPSPASSPSHPSSDSSPFELTGSSLILPVKVRIDPKDAARVARELQEAMSCDFFQVWPTFEDPIPAGMGIEMGMEVSGVYKREMSNEEQERRKEIEREWMAREERSTEGRRRWKGGSGRGEGYESVVEQQALMGMSEWGFKPTLAGGVENETMKSKELSMKGNSQDTRGREDSSRGQKSELSVDTSTSDSTRQKHVSGESRPREHKASREGKEKKAEESHSTEEDHRTSLRPKGEQGARVGSSNIPESKIRFSPWAKKRDGQEDSDDELPFDIKPREGKRARFSNDESLD
jgi:hypothetical protein